MRLLLLVLLAVPASANRKVEVAPVEVRATPGAMAGATAAAGANAMMSTRIDLNGSISPLTGGHAPVLRPDAARSLSSPAPAPAPGLVPAAMPAPADAPRGPVAIDSARLIAADAPAVGEPTASAESAAGTAGSRFEGSKSAAGSAADPVSGAYSAPSNGLLPSDGAARRAPASEPRRPLRALALDAAEVGAVAAGIQLVAAILFAALAWHAAHPALAGALWGLGASEMIKHLARLHGRVTGGWQASHDQKMRHDYGTGQLKDIRGRAYGSDRYDEWTPGAVSPRARAVIDAVAVLMGLPWVIGAGWPAVALYLAAAGGSIALRRFLESRRPAPPPDDGRPFEYDR
ncbi:MAG: hypothetical protein SF051_01130 [Elusimicrobiota bacterium]|nr:hypothetical protein [Elusimicrobiota bacterium]